MASPVTPDAALHEAATSARTSGEVVHILGDPHATRKGKISIGRYFLSILDRKNFFID